MRANKRVIHLVGVSWVGGTNVTFLRDPGWSRAYVNPSRASLLRLVRAVRRAGLEVYPFAEGWSAKPKSS